MHGTQVMPAAVAPRPMVAVVVVVAVRNHQMLPVSLFVGQMINAHSRPHIGDAGGGGGDAGGGGGGGGGGDAGGGGGMLSNCYRS